MVFIKSYHHYITKVFRRAQGSERDKELFEEAKKDNRKQYEEKRKSHALTMKEEIVKEVNVKIAKMFAQCEVIVLEAEELVSDQKRDTLWCTKCQSGPSLTIPWFKLQIRVMDGTGIATDIPKFQFGCGCDGGSEGGECFPSSNRLIAMVGRATEVASLLNQGNGPDVSSSCNLYDRRSSMISKIYDCQQSIMTNHVFKDKNTKKAE
ncbi:hypothetical protein Tco_0896656 [Tanacetum coccineum]